MQFKLGFVSALLASSALAAPLSGKTAAALQPRQLCAIGLPCALQVIVNNAWASVYTVLGDVNYQVALVNAEINAQGQVSAALAAQVASSINTTSPVVAALQSAAANLVSIADQTKASVGPLSASAQVQLEAEINTAISAGIGMVTLIETEIATAVATISTAAAVGLSLGAQAGATISAPVTGILTNVVNVVNAIEAFIGPCNPPAGVSAPPA